MVAIDTSALTAVTPPPRKASATGRGPGRPRKDATPAVPQQSEAQRRSEGLAVWAQLGQGGCLLFGQYADAATIGMHGEKLAVEIGKVASMEGNEWLAKPVDFLIQLGPYTALLAVALPFVMQIAANHKMIDTKRLGPGSVVPPEVLDAQMRARMAQMQAEETRKQQEAMEEAEAARQEYERYVMSVTEHVEGQPVAA